MLVFARYEPPGASRANTGLGTMNTRKIERGSALSAALCMAMLMGGDADAKSKPTPPSPETLLCPPTSGDLDYGLYKVMESAKFQQWGGSMSWRRKADGPFHLRSMEPAQYLRIEFKTFNTSEGTRLIADLWWQTSKYEIGVKQQEIVDIFQGMLNDLQGVFPCR